MIRIREKKRAALVEARSEKAPSGVVGVGVVVVGVERVR